VASADIKAAENSEGIGLRQLVKKEQMLDLRVLS